MPIEFTHWPAELAEKYRSKGYWQDLPLTDIIFGEKAGKDDHVAVIDRSGDLTYGEFRRKVRALGASLHAQGLKPWDTAIVQLGNTADFYIVFFALMTIGVVPVNALASHRQLELTSYAEQIQPRLLIGNREGALFRNGNEHVENLKKVSPNLEYAFFLNSKHKSESLHALIDIYDGAAFSPTPTPGGEVAFFNLSGGSTGTPKLIPRTHNDYYYSVKQSTEVCQFTDETRLLVAIPAPHNFPVSSPGAFGTFCAGGAVVMAADPSAATCFPLIEKHKINVAALVPPAASLWLQEIQESPEKSQQILSSLRMLQVGGARCSPVLAQRISSALPQCTLQQVLGMAEGLVNYTRLDDSEERKITTQGCPMCVDDELWVADADGSGRKLGVNEVGLLMTRGPYTFRGYYKAPEHNKKCFDSEGFYCSDDLISVDEHGYVTVHGRQKDQINRGGEKVSSEEIENLLLRHPDVLEAGIIAIEDEVMGEKSCAYIMTRKPLKVVVLRKFLREQGIAEYKLPDVFKELPELPLTPVGKVDKKQLRVLAAQL